MHQWKEPRNPISGEKKQTVQKHKHYLEMEEPSQILPFTYCLPGVTEMYLQLKPWYKINLF